MHTFMLTHTLECQKLCTSSVPANPHPITFRVFSSLECDWKRKTMHWSSLDSLLLSALQQKHGREKGRRKINHIYIILTGWVKKKKKGKTDHTVVWLPCTHEPGYAVSLALRFGNPLSMCRAKVKAIQKWSSAFLTFQFRGKWEQSMATSKLEGGADKPIDWFDTVREKTALCQSATTTYISGIMNTMNTTCQLLIQIHKFPLIAKRNRAINNWPIS